MNRRGLGLAALALVLTGALVHLRAESARAPKAPWGRNHYPAYDAYVYAAMAESPTVFTLAPWGYRLLTPLAVHALPGRDPVKRFERVARFGIVVSAALLAAWVHTLGFRPAAALAAALALVASAPVGVALREPFLAEPLALALLLALCLAAERGASAGVLALVAAIGAVAKETTWFALPVVLHAAHARGGLRGLSRAAAAVVGPLAAVSALLRLGWAPHLPASGPALSGEALPAALLSVVAHADQWWLPLLQGGALPLALAGACLQPARAYLVRYGVTLAALLALPFVAAVYPGEAGFAGFFSADIPRLLLYPFPLLLPLALHALAAVLPSLGLRQPAAEPWHAGRALSRTALVLALLAVAALAAGLDRYRRADLSGLRDGPYVLGFVRESLRAAARLERGLAVEFDPDQQRFAWGVSDAAELSRLRWPLRDGWGPAAHYGVHEVRLRGASAALVVPAFAPVDLRFALRLAADGPGRVQVHVNGRPLGVAIASAEGVETALVLPAARLFRGDNEVRLLPLGGARRVRLLWAGWEPLATSGGS